MHPASMSAPSLTDRLLANGCRHRLRLVQGFAAIALLACAAAYALAGPVRGAVLPVPVVVLMLAMAAMPPHRVRQLGVGAIVLFGVAMAGMAAARPAVYAPVVEAMHFGVLSAALLAVGAIAGPLAGLRQRVREQQGELEKALAFSREQATRDEVTGLVNRRYAHDVLALEHQRCMRSGHPFCVAMIDLDPLETIDAQRGAAAGDEVMRLFANEALDAIRISDVLARWGGHQFLLLMTDTRGSLGRLGVDRLRERIARLPAPGDGVGATGRLSFSAGVAEHRAGEPVVDTIARADQALDAARAQGRNRVVLH
jgi:diguanylate cyclase (GGDEF)-like protein